MWPPRGKKHPYEHATTEYTDVLTTILITILGTYVNVKTLVAISVRLVNRLPESVIKLP